MGDNELIYSVWVTARPAPDLPGQWVAHCLDFDVISQGDSLQHAMTMIAEATGMVVVEDLKSHRDPLSRRAPEDEFDELWEMVKSGERVSRDVAFADQTRDFVYAFPVELRLARAVAPGASTPKPSVVSARPRVPDVAFTKHVAAR